MLNLIENKAHLTLTNAQLLKFKATLPKGLTSSLKKDFPKIIPENLPEYKPVFI
jgi:hypothetical protein